MAAMPACLTAWPRVQLLIPDERSLTPAHREQRRDLLELVRMTGMAVPSPSPADLDLYLVVDNYAADKRPTVTVWPAQHPRFHLYFTPPRHRGSARPGDRTQ